MNLYFEFISEFLFKFTYEVEHNSKISLLDILLMTNNRELETTVFCKETNNHIYIGGLFFLLHGKKVHSGH